MKYLTIFISNLFLIFAADSEELIIKHGGVIKATDSVFLEVVQEKERTNIYITPRGQKSIDDQKLSLSALVHIRGKEYPMQLSYVNEHYWTGPGTTHLQKEKNMLLKLTITLPGKTENINFNLK